MTRRSSNRFHCSQSTILILLFDQRLIAPGGERRVAQNIIQVELEKIVVFKLVIFIRNNKKGRSHSPV